MAQSDPYQYDYDTYQPPVLSNNYETTSTNEQNYTHSFTPFDYGRDGLTHTDLQSREEYLKDKEQMLNSREAEVNGEIKNWPRCYPIINHDIFGNIPKGPRRVATCMGYIGWYVFALVIILNLAGAIASVVLDWKLASFSTKKKVQYLFMASFYLLTIPGFFIFAYYPLYNAMRTVNMTRFIVFFLGNFALIVFTGFGVGGWIEYGPCGIVGAVQFGSKGLTNKNALAGFIIQLVMAGIWLFLAIYFLVTACIAIWVYWKQNSTFAKAKGMAKKAMDNRRSTVQEVPDTASNGTASYQPNEI